MYNFDMNVLIRRLPALPELWRVYAVIVFLVYTWAIILFLWNVPRWILSLTLPQIGILAAYSFSFALVDSLLFLIGVLIVTVLLPMHVLRDLFISAGSALGASSFVCVVFFQSVAPRLIGIDLRAGMAFVFLSFVLIILVVYATHRLPLIRLAATWIADTLTLFLYIYIPIGVASAIIVFVRNIG